MMQNFTKGYSVTYESKYSARSMFCIQNHQIQDGKFSCQESTPEEYFCSECVFSTHLKAYFMQHIRESHCLKKENEETNLVLNTYKCQKCNFWTFSSLILLKHEMNCERKHDEEYTEKKKNNVGWVLVDDVRWYLCPHCNHKTKHKSSLKNHILHKHTPSNLIPWFICKDCTYKAKTKSRLIEHIKVCHTSAENIKSYDCNQCKHTSKNLSSLKKHIKYNHDVAVKLYNCDFCKYTTRRPTHLKSHMYTKHSYDVGIKVHFCDQCEFKTTRSVDLKIHKVRKHNSDVIKYLPCSFCDYETISPRSLKRHIEVKHTAFEDIKWVECDQCEFKAKSSSTLYQHKQSNHKRSKHSSVEKKRFKCDQCECTFTHISKAKDHVLRKHTADEHINWFLCDQCGYRCKIKQDLISHLANHSLVKTFHCDQCDFKCKRRYYLKNHLLTHSLDRNFQCNQCESKFKMKNNLRRHIRKMHKASHVHN